MSEMVFAKAVNFVLLAMLEPIKKSVAEGKLTGNPGVGVGIRRSPASHDVGIAIVAGKLKEAVESRPRSVSRRYIDGIVPFPYVEGRAVHANRLDGQRNQHVWIGVAVA